MKRFAWLLLGGLFCGVPAQASQNRNDIMRIEASIERMGTKVYWASVNYPGCNDGKGALLGFYSPPKNHVVLCNLRGQDSAELLDTIKHEGWHAAQHRCNRYRPVLSDAQIRQGLSTQDRMDLRRLYRTDRQRGEAEARAVAKLPTPVYLRGFHKVCGL